MCFGRSEQGGNGVFALRLLLRDSLFLFVVWLTAQGTEEQQKRYQQTQSYYTSLKQLELNDPTAVRNRVALAFQFQDNPDQFVDNDKGQTGVETQTEQ